MFNMVDGATDLATSKQGKSQGKLILLYQLSVSVTNFSLPFNNPVFIHKYTVFRFGLSVD